jgi:hypothetical protein
VSTWNDRSPEEARLLNSSFLGLLVWSAAAGYLEVTGSGLPIELAFVALPVSLHSPTRKALPRTTRTSLAAWLEENTSFRVALLDRAKGLAPFVREGILFALTNNLLTLRENGELLTSARPNKLNQYLSETTDEVRDCIKRAEFVGKWFAMAGTPVTVMALWGVIP